MVVSACDNCTQWLLNDIDWMAHQLTANTSFLENGTLHPPWQSLKTSSDRFAFYNSQFDSYVDQTQRARTLIGALDIERVEKQIDRARNKTEHSTAKSLSNISLKEVKEVALDIDETRQKLNGITNTLQNFGKSHVSTKEALKQAREIMRLINNIAKGMKYPNEEVLKKCTQIHHLVGKMALKLNGDTGDVKPDLQELKNKLVDLETNLVIVDETASNAHAKNRHNQIRLDVLNEIVGRIDETDRQVEKELKHTNKLIKDSLKSINSTLGYNEQLLRDEELDDLIDELQLKDSSVATFDSGKLLQPVLTHVAQLERNSSDYGK